MSITVNILYTSTNGQARKFAEEMERNNPEFLYCDRWKVEKHHKSEMMAQIKNSVKSIN